MYLDKISENTETYIKRHRLFKSMQLTQKDKHTVTLSLEGEDHTIGQFLKEELYKDENIKVASFRIKHPLIGTPELLVETNGKEDPKKAILAAIKRMSSQFDKLNEQVKKEIK